MGKLLERAPNQPSEADVLNCAIEHWRAAETEVSVLSEAIKRVLHLQIGVSAQAKSILRGALAKVKP